MALEKMLNKTYLSKFILHLSSYPESRVINELISGGHPLIKLSPSGEEIAKTLHNLTYRDISDFVHKTKDAASFRGLRINDDAKEELSSLVFIARVINSPESNDIAKNIIRAGGLNAEDLLPIVLSLQEGFPCKTFDMLRSGSIFGRETLPLENRIAYDISSSNIVGLRQAVKEGSFPDFAAAFTDYFAKTYPPGTQKDNNSWTSFSLLIENSPKVKEEIWNKLSSKDGLDLFAKRFPNDFPGAQEVTPNERDKGRVIGE